MMRADLREWWFTRSSIWLHGGNQYTWGVMWGVRGDERYVTCEE